MSSSTPSTERALDTPKPGAATSKDPYGKIGRWYDRLVEPAAGRSRGVAFELCPPRPGMRVLDMGCGTGTQLLAYRRAGCIVSGVDPSPAMLAVARRKLGADADLRLESAAHTSFADATFDLVGVALVLHEMRASMRAGVLRECARVVRADGAIVAADFRPGPYAFPKGWAYKAVIVALEIIIGGREHFANYRHFIAHQGLLPLLQPAGLRVDLSRLVAGGTAGVYVLKPAAQA